MIQEFVFAWDTRKDKLREWISAHEQVQYDCYLKLVKVLFEQVINPYMEGNNNCVFDLDRLHEIDDGEYQGSLLYVIPMETYQPSASEYVCTFVDYGSCSGCDTLFGISMYEDGLPSTEQVGEYMDLCLHILQRCRWMFRNMDEG